MTIERTLAIIKPDMTKKNLVGEIIKICEQKGFQVIGLKMLRLTQEDAANFYAEHQTKPFFASLVNFMRSGPVVVVCLSGENAISSYRKIMGATNPHEATAGTIRQIFGASLDENAVHGSDSSTAAQREINFFFTPPELFGETNYNY